ncbi:MAG: peptidyl-prolyl cis-trans isomerase [Thermodesulfobacteriota bacterium]
MKPCLLLSSAVALTLACAAALAPAARSAPVDGLAAVVDGRVITRSELQQALVLAERTGLASGPGARDQVLEGLIEKALVESEARRMGVAVAAEEVERAVADIRKRNGLDEAGFRGVIEGQGMDYGEYLGEVRSQILRLKVAGRALRARLQVSDEALREHYLKNVAEFCDPDAVRLFHVQARGDDARSAAEAARARLLAGEDPASVARDVSPSATGADMGYVPLANLSEEVRDALREADPSGVTPVVEMRGACHVFVVADRQGGRIPDFEEVRDRVRERYFLDREEELFQTWIESLKAQARIVRKM